jgi:hypothetical protein
MDSMADSLGERYLGGGRGDVRLREDETVPCFVGADGRCLRLVDDRNPVGIDESGDVARPAGRETAVDHDVDALENLRNVVNAEPFLSDVDFRHVVATVAELAEQELLVATDARVEDTDVHEPSPRDGS